MNDLDSWETKFAGKLEQIDLANRQRAGILLSLIPCPDEWEEFLNYICAEWRYFNGKAVRQEQPHCLIILFGGIAFYKYDANQFWPQFAQAIGSQSLPANQQQEIAEDFVKAAHKLRLRLQQHQQSKDYVGSAVYHIGIPLSFWDVFLEICEWALWQDNWEGMSDAEWTEFCTRRALNRPRLRKFLTDNREAATEFIKEMHNARRILTEDDTLTINDLKQASLLRPEYFDEVPETAEFLRPSNPDSLFKDRARLIWNEDRACISLHLPAVAKEKLPAIWKLGNIEQPAASTPDILHLDSAAFSESLILKLASGERCETQQLRGLSPFGLFDSERNKFVKAQRQTLPIGSYALISRDALPDLSLRGFDDEENPTNDRCELADGTTCYLTRLWPTGKSAEISFSRSGETQKIAFRSGLKIEARIFAGEGSYAANFSRHQEWIKVERLPLLCLAVPFGSFEETASVLQRKFQVWIGEQTIEGTWEKRHEDEHQEFYVWRWINEPQPRKKVYVSIKAPELGIRFDYQIEMLQQKQGLADCWQNLPGAFLPWCLLAQPVAGMKEGMKWQDLLLAREAIAPNDHASLNRLRYRLREYVNRGLLAQRGHTWTIAESRAKFDLLDDGWCQMSYCGNPAILWGLFRYLHDQFPNLPLTQIEVISQWGELPYLLMRWKAEQQRLAQKYLSQKQHAVRIVSDLWRP